MLTTPHCKECVSRAYVTAVVGRARHKLNWNSEHDYGVDGYVRKIEKRGSRHYETGFGFDFQSKTTTSWILDGDNIVYDLEADAHNDLVSRAGTGALPFLLVLLCIHQDETLWLEVSPDKLTLQKCAYWLQVDGALTDNLATRRVRIPTGNLFSPQAVSDLLDAIKSGAMKP
jgi:hypothetical protein